MDNINTYFEQIKDIPLLDADTEKELMRQWREEKSTQARDILIQNYLRLVASIAKNYINLGLSYDDLIQEGNLGLMHAIDTFDPQYKNKISTYATWWIRHNITRALTNKARLIRVPATIIEAGKEPEVEVSYSIDAPLGDNGEDTFADTLIYHAPSADEIIMKEEMRCDLMNILATLEERESKVLRARFGIGAPAPKTLEEIGSSLGVSKERVRQIEQTALRKLRNPVRTRMIMEYV